MTGPSLTPKRTHDWGQANRAGGKEEEGREAGREAGQKEKEEAGKAGASAGREHIASSIWVLCGQ